MTTHELICGDVRQIQPTLPSQSVNLMNRPVNTVNRFDSLDR